MKITELKGLNNEELQEKLLAEKAKLTRMKLDHAISPLENPSQIKALRKDIARIETEMRLRELNVQ